MADPTPDFQAQLRALQEAFAKELPKRIDDLEIAWEVGDSLASRLEAVRRQAHSLAGSGGTFGFPELSQAARALERRVQFLQQAPSPLDPTLETEIDQEVRALRMSAGPGPSQTPTQEVLSPQSTVSGGLVRILSQDPFIGSDLVPQLQAFGFDVELYDHFGAFKAALGKGETVLALVDLEDPGAEPVDLSSLGSAGRVGGALLPLVVLSDQGDLASRLQAVRAGAKAYFSKPLDAFTLLDRIDAVNPALQQDPVQVLIIEDDPVLAQNNALVLRSGGAESTIVNDPMQALRPLVDHPPDLILMDLDMPG